MAKLASKIVTLGDFAVAAYVSKLENGGTVNYETMAEILNESLGRDVEKKSVVTASSQLRKKLENGVFKAAEIEAALAYANRCLTAMEIEGAEPMGVLDIPQGQAGRGAVDADDKIANVKKRGKVVKVGSIGFDKAI